jgi:HK97 family phage portal protein
MAGRLRQFLDTIRILANRAQEPKRLPQQPGSGLFLGAESAGTGGKLAQMESYGQVSWLFAVVNRIAQAVAASEWRLYRVGPNRQRSRITQHPLLALLTAVNPFYTREELLECSQQHLELVGEAWWVILRNGAGQPVELWPIRPDRMAPVPHPQQFIAGYVYSIGQERIPLAKEDVVFIRMSNPLDAYRGAGPVQSLLSDLGSEASAAQWTRNFFKNSAEPGGIIEYDQELSDPEFERLVSRWQAQHRGVANAHRVAIVERGHWIDRKYSFRDMMFPDLRKLNRDIILGAFGMPASLLGITESVNRANAEAGEVMFSKWVIRPRLQRIRAAINERLCPLFGPDLEFDFLDPTPANRELALAEADRGYRAGLVTRNEARRRLNEPAVPGGDEFAPLIIAPGLSADGESLVGAKRARKTRKVVERDAEGRIVAVTETSL